LSKLSIIFKEWRVMNNGELLFSLYFKYNIHRLFFVTRLIIVIYMMYGEQEMNVKGFFHGREYATIYYNKVE
jgi:hypothetical protein